MIAAYAFGAVLDGPADLPMVQMAFVLTLPAEELTWCAQPLRALFPDIPDVSDQDWRGRGGGSRQPRWSSVPGGRPTP